jgi:hypothetical protein
MVSSPGAGRDAAAIEERADLLEMDHSLRPSSPRMD